MEQHEAKTMVPITDTSLPEGWIEISLDQLLASLEAGSRPKGGVREIKHGIPSLGGEHLSDDGGFKFDTIKFVPHSFFEKMSHGLIRIGDILVVKDGATTGKISLVRAEFPYDLAVVNEHVFICRPDKNVHSPFLFYFLFSREGQDRILENFQGSAQGGINKSFAPGTAVLLAPLAEQHRIVAKVEDLLARVNVARERLAKVPVILKRFRQSVLAAACSGRLTAEWRAEQTDLESASELINHVSKSVSEKGLSWREPNPRSPFPAREGGTAPLGDPNPSPFPCGEGGRGVRTASRGASRTSSKQHLSHLDTSGLSEIPDEWTWIRLPDLGELSRGRSRHRPRNAPYLYGGPYPFIQTGDIAQSGGRIAHHKQTYSQAGLSQSRLWPSGTVCITIAANIADSAILTYPACFPDSVVGLIVEPDLCVAEYAEFFIRTARDDLSQFAPATAQKNINMAILSDVVVPLPPLSEQREIVRRVEALFALADAIEQRVAAATARAEKLTQAVLARAFRGELVPTEAELARREGRDYEPATVLLEQIQANKAEEVLKAGKKGQCGKTPLVVPPS